MHPTQSGMLATSPPTPESPLETSTPDRRGPAPFRLEEAPVYRDAWARQHPSIHLLFHRDIITHLVWCAAACRYLTGGADGAVKLWRSELQPRASSSHATSSSCAEHPVLIPEAHVITLGGPVTGLCASGQAVGNSEVAVVASTDGTLTLCRTGTHEIIRTLRGARGESLEPSRQIAPPQCGPALSGLGKDHVSEEGDSGALARGDQQLTHRYFKGPTWYAAEAYSCRLAPSSDMAIVRRPVYTVRAYRNEAREALTSSSNEYFQGLRTVAPTYEHLTQHEEKNADVLAQFSVAPAPPTSTPNSTMPRQWYASAIALAAAPAVIYTSNVSGGGGALSSHSALDPLLLLGFPKGLVQAYVLPQRWFSLHQHGETRLDPPAVRVPVFSGLLHSATVLGIEVLVGRDMVVSVSEDCTTQLRRLSCLHAPLRQLGVVVSLPTPVSHVPPSPLKSLSSRAPSLWQHVGSADGHSRPVTCCCVDEEHQLLITGSADHTLCWWNLMAGSSSIPIRVVTLRDTATAADLRSGADGTPSSPSNPPALVVRGGYPVDVSLFRRRLLDERSKDASPAVVTADDASGRSSLGRSFQMALFLLVLDTERVVRIFDALSGKLIASEIEPRTAATATASGVVDKLNSVTKEARLARYDCVNGTDRVLLGGLYLVPWYLARSVDSAVMRGHTASIFFTAWCASLKCAVTADAHHVLFWRLRAGQKGDPTAEVLRAWRITAGIRSVALCDTEATDEHSHLQRPSLFIAHESEAVIGQYDCLLSDSSPAHGTSGLPQPHLLQRLSLHDSVSVNALAAVTAVARRSSATQGVSSAEVVTAYALAVGHATRGTGGETLHGASGESRLLMYPLLLSSATTVSASTQATATIDGAAGPIAPLRELRLSGSHADGNNSIVSVLGLPCANLVVVGGRRVLYTAPLSSMATSAVPCDPLPLGRAAAAQPRWRGSNLSMRAPQPTAVFPGPLISLDDSTTLSMANGEAAEQADGDAMVAVALADSLLTGFLSRLVHIPHDTAASAPDSGEAAVCLVLSGSNDGLVQLWDVHHGRELWQCRAVMTREPITALAVHHCDTQWLVAAGDQSGVLTLLDITSVVQAARQVVAADAQGPRKPGARTTGWPQHGLEREEGRMLDRWLAHADAVSGAFFTTVPAGVSDEAATALQLLTTGEDSAVMLWTLPSCSLLSTSPITPNYELSGILLLRPCERADATNHRRSHAPVRVQPSIMKLPWAARQAYEALRQQYVRERLLDGKSTELSAALMRFYMPAKPLEGTTAGESANVEPGEEESEEEAKLIDRAWAVLTADVRAFSRSVVPAEPQGDALAVAPRPLTVVQAWCKSLSPDVTAKHTATAFSSNLPATKIQPHCDKNVIKTSCKSVTPSTVPSSAAGRPALPPSPLILAFADRCCDGHGRGGCSSARQRSTSEFVARASSVRECLRQTLRVVVQSSVENASSQRALGTAMATQRRHSIALGPSLLPSVADPFEFADKTLPLPGKPSLVSDETPNCIEGANSEVPRTPPACALISTSPGGLSHGGTPNSLTQQVANHGATPRRYVGFTGEGGEPRSAPCTVPAAPLQSQSSRMVVTYRVGYSVHAPLVRSTSADRCAGASAKHGRLLRKTTPEDARDTAMNEFATAPRLSERHFVDDDAGLNATVDAPYGGLAGGDTAAIVMQHANRHRRRAEALQCLIMLEQADLNLCCRGTARKGTADGKRKLAGDAVGRPVLRGGGTVALGLPQCSVRRASATARQWERSLKKKQPKTCTGGSSQRSGSPQAAVVSPPKVPLVLVSDAYLKPVLTRVGASSALLSDYAAAARTTTANRTALSLESASVYDSAWYAERQRRRDAAREKARLWNSHRVMKTLLGWTASPGEPSSDIEEPLSATAGRFEDGRIFALGTKATTMGLSNPLTAAGKTSSPPVLTLPPILALRSPTANSLSPVVDDAMASPDAAAAALAALLCVSPTTAIDAAVHHGLPSRKVLHAEMAAAKARMRQSVQLRAACQREHRSMATEVGDDNVVDVVEQLDSVDTDSLSEEQRDPDKATSADSVGRRSHQGQMKSGHGAPIAASISPLGKSGCAPRRALQSHEGAEPRRMATVPLPTATTRQELFGNSTWRHK
ncbi:conserved hypothetical protein [Leishmania braziliensis MHOM/BR/75/M2904]|uniref:Uncharacterized protein n=2 Tax=Leishmania braziliensis TaxID=5660 RepID=A4HM90_LEIBR|nr:conserved hypothetical protein [Leishmania braziliensis MHOM/BR/75/M2904]CAJ2480065.1 unnamed protein product [Leishmania braziliensis]CAM43274.2 conserved hypothetical protein [Leishmania braziliensis MHOM/BR/75/M2904]SYZ69343.1 WD_domain [Leishmania braziliensis MHOM/BR/75/M2904]